MIDLADVDRRVHLIRQRCHKLSELARLDTTQFLADERLAPCAERHLHVACEACVELGLTLIGGLNLRRPTSYEEIGEILTGAGLASPDYAPQIERIVKVRNLLVHGYTGIEPHALHNQLGPRIMDVEFFANQAALFARRVA
jgi:uncharacterized protein YutE (UPF0331/DUF86 family)